MNFAKEVHKLWSLGNYQAGIRLIDRLVNIAYMPGLMLLEHYLASYPEIFGSSERLLQYIEENTRSLSIPADNCRHMRIRDILNEFHHRRNPQQEDFLPPGQIYCLLVSERTKIIDDDCEAFAQYLYPGWVDKGVIPPIDVERSERNTESLEVAQHAFTCAAAYLVQEYNMEVPGKSPHWIFTEASGRVSLTPYIDVSHGLAAAVAYVSKMLKMEVPADKAITGIINHDSSFSASGVKAIAEKITAAYYWHQPRINQVIIPRSNLNSIPDFCKGKTDFEIKTVSNLEQCLDAIFGREQIEQAINAFDGSRGLHERPREKPHKPEAVIGLRPAASKIFKDREDKIAELRRLLYNPEVKFICITGRGGIGKTALLFKICADIESGELQLSDTSKIIGVDGILYISLRGIGKLTLEQLYHDFGCVLGSPHYEELMDYWSDAFRSLLEKARFLLSKLRNGYYLLVLDNFEDFLNPNNTIEDTNLQAFVDLCLTTSNALYLVATSRKRMVVGGQDIRAVRILTLDNGLPDNDGMALLLDLDLDGELGLRNASNKILRDAVQRCYTAYLGHWRP